MINFLYGIFASTVIFLANCVATNGLAVQKNVSYGPDGIQRADIYSPKMASDRPVIVYWYGGGWRGGSKDRSAFVGGALARQGFVVVVPEYRHFPQVGLADILEDQAAAVVWTLAHAKEIGGDPRRVILAGSSSGAWGAAMLALDPRWLERLGTEPGRLAGMIGLAGPYMVSSLNDPSDKAVFKGSGTDMEPIEHVTNKHTPILLLTGTADTDVSPISTATLMSHLHCVVGTEESRYYDGFGHVDIILSLAFPFNRSRPVLGDIAKFANSLPKS